MIAWLMVGDLTVRALMTTTAGTVVPGKLLFRRSTVLTIGIERGRSFREGNFVCSEKAGIAAATRRPVVRAAARAGRSSVASSTAPHRRESLPFAPRRRES